ALFNGKDIAGKYRGVQIDLPGRLTGIIVADDGELFTSGALLKAPGNRNRLSHGKAGGIWISSRLLNFAVYKEISILFDRDSYLRIKEVAPLKSSGNEIFQGANSHPADLDLTQNGKGQSHCVRQFNFFAL